MVMEHASATMASVLLVMLAGLEGRPVPPPLTGLRVGNTRLTDDGESVLMIYTDTANITITIEAKGA